MSQTPDKPDTGGSAPSLIIITRADVAEKDFSAMAADIAALRAENARLRDANARHALHHIEKICGECGHDKDTDGKCANCIEQKLIAQEGTVAIAASVLADKIKTDEANKRLGEHAMKLESAIAAKDAALRHAAKRIGNLHSLEASELWAAASGDGNGWLSPEDSAKLRKRLACREEQFNASEEIRIQRAEKIRGLECENAKLREERDAALEDSADLDWLERHVYPRFTVEDEKHVASMSLTICMPSGRATCPAKVRDAIRAARSAQRGR